MKKKFSPEDQILIDKYLDHRRKRESGFKVLGIFITKIKECKKELKWEEDFLKSVKKKIAPYMKKYPQGQKTKGIPFKHKEKIREHESNIEKREERIADWKNDIDH